MPMQMDDENLRAYLLETQHRSTKEALKRLAAAKSRASKRRRVALQGGKT